MFYLRVTGKTGHQRWLKFLSLFREQCDVAAGGQCHYTKMLREAPYYIQRLPADRAGAAEQSYAPWEIAHMFLFNLKRCIVLHLDYSMDAQSERSAGLSRLPSSAHPCYNLNVGQYIF